jgi:uncharacterized membrane protein YdjX (TVP38/TMEM64 family)
MLIASAGARKALIGIADAVLQVKVGSVLAWLGTTIGQTLAFIVGRYLLR